MNGITPLKRGGKYARRGRERRSEKEGYERAVLFMSLPCDDIVR